MELKKIRTEREKVVFEKVLATYPGGVKINTTDAKARFTNGVIPAGTLVVPDGANGFKVLNATLAPANTTNAVGLVRYDVVIDEHPTVAVVTDGIVRVDALPDKEKTGLQFIKTALPSLKFW